METSQLVENGKALVEAMGYWPSFHDANVLATHSDAGAFTVTVHLFAMTDQVDSAGYYALEKHHRVTIVMHDMQSSSLPPGYSDDCLASLSFSRVGDLLQVDFESHMDQDGTVLCNKVEIASIIPCDSKGVALASNNSFKPKPLRGSA
ncbi:MULTISPECIES: Imm50 family immunity protein [unclassified Lysobacter]|uniref:Imm50 family immunity protein n=1 Tax=unclassified Lysobacter TaxID=2635362 RepID=UPI0009E91DBF|nr:MULTISPECIES: Imm50 family immunity protein [unclassified Lysobacter]